MSAEGLRFERLMDGRHWRRYEVSTGETVEVWAPWTFLDDFVAGTSMADSAGESTPWVKIDTNTGAAVAVAANAVDKVNGAWELTTTTSGNSQLAEASWNDVLSVPVTTSGGATRGTQIEFRFKIKSASMTAITAQLGLMAARNDAVASVARKAWFYLNASLDLSCQTDDNGTDSGIVASDETLVSEQWYIGRIDLSDLSDVKFYLDGARLCSDTTFTMAALGNSYGMQPVIAVRKTGTGSTAAILTVDYVRIWSLRLGE